jgi:broad specificity phosphatase PhoE
MIERRRILLMRHGAVEYFDAQGRAYPPDAVPLTPAGIEQARAMGAALAAHQVRVDRVIISGLLRTQMTAREVLAGLASGVQVDEVQVDEVQVDEVQVDQVPVEEVPALQEIRPGRLADIPPAQLRDAFIGAFEGPVPRDVPFLNGETIGALLDRVLPAMRALLATSGWDTTLMVLHGGVNRAILSWFLTGQNIFLGGLAQDPGCLNIIDVGPTPAASVVRVVNFCVLDPLQTATRLSTMEHLLHQYLQLRELRNAAEGEEDTP